METINEALTGALYFSLNPLVWVAAIAVSLQTRKLRNPIIAAVATQMLCAGLLMSLAAFTDRAYPLGELIMIVLVPAVLSGLLVSALVIPFAKWRQLRKLEIWGHSS